jgi:hypothetical protein
LIIPLKVDSVKRPQTIVDITLLPGGDFIIDKKGESSRNIQRKRK